MKFYLLPEDSRNELLVHPLSTGTIPHRFHAPGLPHENFIRKKKRAPGGGYPPRRSDHQRERTRWQLPRSLHQRAPSLS